jgi:RHS repeat-associated protein
LASNPNRTILYDVAYAPFGESYAGSGTPDLSFTGMNEDTSTTGLYDFLYREYSTQGRWSEPDPGGLPVVNPAFPQSWNRYAYVLNGPLGFVDPLGFCGGGPGGVTVSINGSITNSGLFTSPPCPGGGSGGDSGGLGSGHYTPSLDAPPNNLPGGGGGGTMCFSDSSGTVHCTVAAPNSGNSSGGFWQRTTTVNQCAAKNASSLASVFHANQNNFWVSTFLGYDASALSNLTFGPGRMDSAASLAVSNPTKYSLINLGANAVGHIPTGGQIYVASALVQTPCGEAINMTPVSQTIGGVAGKAVGAAAEAFTAVKAVFDVQAYIYAEVGCAVK